MNTLEKKVNSFFATSRKIGIFFTCSMFVIITSLAFFEVSWSWWFLPFFVLGSLELGSFFLYLLYFSLKGKKEFGFSASLWIAWTSYFKGALAPWDKYSPAYQFARRIMQKEELSELRKELHSQAVEAEQYLEPNEIEFMSRVFNNEVALSYRKLDRVRSMIRTAQMRKAKRKASFARRSAHLVELHGEAEELGCTFLKKSFGEKANSDNPISNEGLKEYEEWFESTLNTVRRLMDQAEELSITYKVKQLVLEKGDLDQAKDLIEAERDQQKFEEVLNNFDERITMHLEGALLDRATLFLGDLEETKYGSREYRLARYALETLLEQEGA